MRPDEIKDQLFANLAPGQKVTVEVSGEGSFFESTTSTEFAAVVKTAQSVVPEEQTHAS